MKIGRRERNSSDNDIITNVQINTHFAPKKSLLHLKLCHARESGHPGAPLLWIPAYAGMTVHFICIATMQECHITFDERAI